MQSQLDRPVQVIAEVPFAVRRAVKIRAIEREETMRQFIEDALRARLAATEKEKQEKS